MAQKILVVDDEKDMVEMIACNLELSGYAAIRAHDGLEALNKARKSLPDLILLDLMLPDIDGFSLCEILRSQPSTSDIPIIVLTAMAGELPRLHGFESGATDYCIKPIRIRELKERVRNVLATCEAKRAIAELTA